MATVRVAVGADGKLRYVHADAADAVFGQIGQLTARRASHVEPWLGLSAAAQQRWCDANKPTSPPPYDGWFADLGPVNGHVAGPFATKGEALEYEVAWINKHALGADPHAQQSRDGANSPPA